jgi:hypothetical protein
MVIGRSSFLKPVLIATHAAGGMDEPEIGFVTGGIEKICLMMAIWRSARGGIDRKNEILWSGSINFATVCGAPIPGLPSASNFPDTGNSGKDG